MATTSPSPATWVVSDVHGHVDDLRSGLRDVGLLDARDRWTGADAELWVLGDLFDRGPDGLAVARLLQGLQEQAAVRVLLGNHEILTLGTWLHPGGAFDQAWRRNGGVPGDQAGLTADDVAWLRLLPAMGRAGDHLLVHSDTDHYLRWGRSVHDVNARVGALLGAGEAGLAELWKGLCSRFRFTGPRGSARAEEMLATYGGSRLVHGHTILPLITGDPDVLGPVSYAGGQVLAVDGGRYDGGPLLVVRLT